VNVLATVLSGSVIDKLGRKPLMTGSLLGMAVSMLTLAAAMTVRQHTLA
jgi:MFS family permease